MNKGQKTGTNAVPARVSIGIDFGTTSFCPKAVPEKPAKPMDTWLGQMSQFMSQMSQTQSTPISLCIYTER